MICAHREGFDNHARGAFMTSSKEARGIVQNAEIYPDKSIANNRHNKTEDVDNDVITVIDLAGSVRKLLLAVLIQGLSTYEEDMHGGVTSVY